MDTDRLTLQAYTAAIEDGWTDPEAHGSGRDRWPTLGLRHAVRAGRHLAESVMSERERRLTPPHAVRVLTPTEREIAEDIVIAMESMRPMGFLNVAPVTRARRGERTHPRRNENQPSEFAIADLGATRSLRPPRLQAPSRTAAREAVERHRPASANETHGDERGLGRERDD